MILKDNFEQSESLITADAINWMADFGRWISDAQWSDTSRRA
jgi:hypothetical protein